MLHEYFYKNPRIINNIEFKKLCLLDEIKILTLWDQIINIDVKIIEDFDKIKSILLLIMSVSINSTVDEITKLIDTDFENTFQLIQIHAIDYINNVYKNERFKQFFDRHIPETVSGDSDYLNMLGFVEYIYFVILNIDYKSLFELSMSEISILKRFKEIEDIEDRYTNYIDRALAANISKDTVSKQLKEITKHLPDFENTEKENKKWVKNLSDCIPKDTEPMETRNKMKERQLKLLKIKSDVKLEVSNG